MRRTPKNHSFAVIEGGGQKPSAWIDLPKTIIAPSPIDRGQSVAYRVSGLSAQKALEAGNRQPLLDLWSMVYGKIPPVNNARMKWADKANEHGLISIADAIACFRGIKRPIGDDDRGYDVYAYVNKPRILFSYAPSMSCPIEPLEVDDDLVGIVYVKMDYPHGRNTLDKNELATARGIVTHWELAEADESGLLPIESDRRYRRRLW